MSKLFTDITTLFEKLDKPEPVAIYTHVHPKHSPRHVVYYHQINSPPQESVAVHDQLAALAKQHHTSISLIGLGRYSTKRIAWHLQEHDGLLGYRLSWLNPAYTLKSDPRTPLIQQE